MTDAYLLTFEVLPHGNNENRIKKPFDYLFRGVMMKWLKKMNPAITQNLHITDLAGGKKMLREYAIQHETFLKGSPKNGGISGVRFYLNIFQSEMMGAIVKHLMSMNSSTILLGEQKCVISQINIETIALESLFDTAEPIKRFEMMFKSPTAFKQMRSKHYIYQPLPDKIFGNLAKLWTNIVTDPKYKPPEDFYDWVVEYVQPSKTDTKIRAWEMGLRKPPFKGFLGWVRMTCPADEKFQEYLKWLSCLLKFGELANVGSGRTAGFGKYKLMKKIAMIPN